MLVPVLFWRDLRARLVDRSAILLGLVAPFALIAVMSLAMGGTTASSEPVGYVGSTGSPVSRALEEGALAQLESDGTLEVTRYDDAQALRHAVRDGDVAAGIVVAGGPRDSGITVLRGEESLVADTIVEAIADATAAQVDAVGRTVAADRVLGGAADPGAVAEALMTSDREQVRDAETQDGVDGKTQVAAGMATFFLFFTVQFGVVGLAQERREGTLPRVLAAPVRPWQVLLAKVWVSFAVGLLSMAALVATSSLLLGASWGHLAGVSLLVVAGVLAAVATVTLVVGVTRTPDAASGLQAGVALVLGILGGSFFSMARAGDLAAFVTRLTPHHWFMEGLVALSGGASWTAALGPAGMLLLFATVVGIPGLLLAHRTVRP